MREFPPLVYRPMPPITNLTQTLDTQIVCTLCRGQRVVYSKNGPDMRYWPLEACPNCNGSGWMASRTSEEQYNINKERKNPA